MIKIINSGLCYHAGEITDMAWSPAAVPIGKYFTIRRKSVFHFYPHNAFALLPFREEGITLKKHLEKKKTISNQELLCVLLVPLTSTIFFSSIECRR